MPPKIRPIDADQQPKQEAKEAPKVPNSDPPKRQRRGEDRDLREALTRFYANIGGAVVTVGMFSGDVGLVASGTNIGAKAPETAEYWLALSDNNPRVKAFLLSFMEGSIITNLVGAHLSMAVPILAARGIIPAQAGEMFLSDEAKMAAMQFHEMQQAAAASQNGSN